MSKTNRKIRALVFEDDEGIRRILERVLERKNYEVFSFADPSFCPLYSDSECICASSQICSDVILSDIKMLKVDGLTFVKEQIEKGCKVHIDNIAMISGYWTDSLLKEARELKLKIFYKPFSIAIIDKWLGECSKNIDIEKELIESSYFEKSNEK